MIKNFKQDLEVEPLNHVAQRWIIDRTPYVFNNDQIAYVNWKASLANAIGVDGKAIIFIGSASIGFSLNPTKSYRVYNESSDIDIAIVSRHHFEIAWHTIRNLGTLRHTLNSPQSRSLEDHRNRLIYWGTFDTKHLLPKLPFGKQWFETFEQMTSIAPTKDREINARIYRDFESLTDYHVSNLSKLREKLTKPPTQ